MGLLSKATNQTAYLKAGIMGFQGSGKTFTASRIAAGLAKLSNPEKPTVAFFDTETGSDFLIPYFQNEKVDFQVAKYRSFKAVCDFIKECEQSKIEVAIIDSISHVWKEFVEAYKKRKNRSFVSIPDWGILKGQWQQYTDLYINSRVHIIMCGRAAFEYDTQFNEDTGKNESFKSGTKMRVEGETGYEPSLLLEMETVKPDFELLKDKDRPRKIINRCFILKDRTDQMNGQFIDNPRFSDFKPIISFLNLGGEHVGVDTTNTSEEVFESPDRSFEMMQRRRTILLEEIKEAFVLAELDGNATAAKRARTQTLIDIFGTSAWSAIEVMKVPDLDDKVKQLKIKLGLDDEKSEK